MSLKHDLRVSKAKGLVNSLRSFEDTRRTLKDTKMPGKKTQLSRNEKLDRFQHNLTGSASGKARTSWNYYPDEKKAYIS